jgi:hypothetical protein
MTPAIYLCNIARSGALFGGSQDLLRYLNKVVKTAGGSNNCRGTS